MTIPTKLKIGGHTFTVEFVDGFKSDDDDLGECNVKENMIRIRKGLATSQTEQTLLHEMMHAMNSNLDHDLLSSLSEQLYQALKDNRMLK